MFAHGAELDKYSIRYGIKTYDDFVLKPRDTSTRKARSKRTEQPKAAIGIFLYLSRNSGADLLLAGQVALRQ